MAGWTQCVIEQKCYFNDYRNNQTKKYCRILTSKDGQPPYLGKCPFYKKNAYDISGGEYEQGKSVSDVVPGEI